MLISPEGKNRRVLVPRQPDLGPVYIGWSSDSKTIYFKSLDSKAIGQVWSVPASGGSPTRLVNFKQADRVEFATDGKEFFFPLTERESDLWIMKLRR